MNIADHNRRVSYLKFRKQTGLITDAEMRELRASVVLVGGQSDDPNVKALPAAFPAYFPTVDEWVSAGQRGAEEAVIVINSIEQQGPDTEVSPDNSPVGEQAAPDDPIQQSLPHAPRVVKTLGRGG